MDYKGQRLSELMYQVTIGIFGEVGDAFAPHAIENPDLDSSLALLRGWGVHSAGKLAEVVASLRCRGLSPVGDYFPAEYGRDEPAQSGVWPTNTLAKTGAYLYPEVLPMAQRYFLL